MKIGIKWKAIPAVAISFLILVSTILYIFIQGINLHLRLDYHQVIMEAKKSFDNLEFEEIRVLKNGLLNLEDNDTIKNIYLSKDRDKLYQATKDKFLELKNEIGITHWLFHDPDSTIFLRVHAPENYGKPQKERITFKKAEVSKSWGVGMELGNTGFALRVVRPYFKGSELIGYMEFAEEATPFINNMKKETGTDYVMILKKENVDRELWAESRKARGLDDNFDDLNKYVVVAETDAKFTNNQNCYNDSLLDNSGESGTLFSKFASGENTYVCGGFTLNDASGKIVGMIIAIRDITIEEGKIGEVKDVAIYASIVIAIIMSVVIIYLISLIVIRPLYVLSGALEKISKGDLASKLDFRSNDEMGEAGKRFNEMAEKLEKSREELRMSNENLEDAVEERTKELKIKISELEKFQSVTIDREIKMVDLKKKLKELEEKLKGK
jgi:HAMP domain-containing protein